MGSKIFFPIGLHILESDPWSETRSYLSSSHVVLNFGFKKTKSSFDYFQYYWVRNHSNKKRNILLQGLCFASMSKSLFLCLDFVSFFYLNSTYLFLVLSFMCSIYTSPSKQKRAPIVHSLKKWNIRFIVLNSQKKFTRASKPLL